MAENSNSNLPIGAVVFCSIAAFLTLQPVDNRLRRMPLKSKMHSMDFPGAMTLVASIACLLLALQWGGTKYPWSSARIIGLFCGCFLLLLCFSALQWKLGDRATIPPRVLTQRSVMMGCAFSFFLHMSNYIVSSWMLRFALKIAEYVLRTGTIYRSTSKLRRVSRLLRVGSGSSHSPFQK